jgi:hypothetical protein
VQNRDITHHLACAVRTESIQGFENFVGGQSFFRGTRQFFRDSLRLNGDLKSETCPPPRSVPLSGNRLAEATVMRDRQFGNCPKREMNGSKMLQDSDRSRGRDSAKQPSRFGVDNGILPRLPSNHLKTIARH